MNAAFYNTCVRTHSDGLYRFALKFFRRDDLAQDVVQEVFIRLWENRFDVEEEKVKSWLFTTAYRHMVDLHRKKYHQISNEENPAVYGTTEPDKMEWKQLVNYALSKLDDRQKSMVMLRDYEGYAYEEIAEIMGLTLSQIKINLFRARKKLRKILENGMVML